MKMAQINKLYAGFNGFEKASMALDAAVNNDNATLAAIVDSMPMQSFIGVDMDYRRRTNGLYMMAQFYGLCYWRTLAKMQSSTNYAPYLETLAAIEAALLEVCNKFKVDVESIKFLAQCQNETALPGNANPELVEEYAEVFIKLVD
jgi:hypothetical protein